MAGIIEEYKRIGISEQVYYYGEEVLGRIREQFADIDKNAELNQIKVLNAFRENNISEAHLSGTTGYGYHDEGRQKLEKVYSTIFGTGDTLVRPQIACGTHALWIALSGNLRPGDELLSPVGKPYDTLEKVIGIREAPGSLKEYGVNYRQVGLLPDGDFNYPEIEKAINAKTKLVTIQRSCGYDLRPTLSAKSTNRLISFVKKIKADIICLVDNCYCEFVGDTMLDPGLADLIVGSNIKNIGGGICPCGGYVTGRTEYVNQAAYRLTSPGLGKAVGATLESLRPFFQGLFMAPAVTASALKGALFAARIFGDAGFNTRPKANEDYHDIVQAIVFNSPEALTSFSEAIQSVSPVDSYVTPIPAPMAGYNNAKIISAGGTFISGSSIEFSADAPMRPPFAVYLQGGLNFPHAKAGILKAYQNLIDIGVIDKGGTVPISFT